MSFVRQDWCWGIDFGGGHLAVHDGEADPDAASDLAQGLAIYAAGEDRAPLVGVDHARPSASASVPSGGFEAVAGFADEVAAAVLGQGECEVEDQAALGVLSGGDAFEALHRDALFEEVVEHNQAFEEVAAGPVGDLELAADLLLEDLHADRGRDRRAGVGGLLLACADPHEPESNV